MYGKNAPWYCGDDDDDDDVNSGSDGSSGLSASHKNSPKRHKSQSSGSISISGLGSEQSMSLSSIRHEDSTPNIFHKPLDELSVDASLHSVALSKLYPVQENEHSDKEHSDMEQSAEKVKGHQMPIEIDKHLAMMARTRAETFLLKRRIQIFLAPLTCVDFLLLVWSCF
jgi:hypothetical protein